jgi:hypothetical protein
MTSSLKKSLIAAERKRDDMARARRRWRREQGLLDPARLVFIDETAVNAPFHKARGVPEAIEAAGTTLCYLPGSSSNFNAIELVFHPLKTFLCKAAARTMEGRQRCIRSYIRALGPSECVGYFRHAGIFFVYVVVTRACEDERVSVALMTGLAAGLYLETCLVLWQRFGIHLVQATGTFVHQNTLGLVANLVAIPYFTLLLAGRRGWTPATIPFADAIITVFTASRATLGLGGGGFALALVLSVLRRATARKALVALVGALALAAIVPLATRSLETRFQAYGLTELVYDERAILMNAGEMMLADNPNGVGANNFVLVANIKGYEDRAGVDPRKESRSALIHNIYWLAATETGYIGITALLFLLFQPLMVALRCGWRNRDDLRGDLLIGFATALLVFYVHSYFEWTFFTDQVQYLFAMTLGLIASTAQQLGYWQRPKAQRQPPPPRRFVGRSLA